MAPVDHAGSLPQHSLLILVWACFSVAFLFVALRTAIRFKVADRPTADDYWIFLAFATLLTLCILETIQLPSLYYLAAMIAGGAAPKSIVQLISSTETYLRFEFAIIILFWTVLWCVKAGFLALYFKLFRELRPYRRAWYVLATFTFLAYVGCLITLCMSCGPISNFFSFAQCGRPEDVWASNLSVYYSTAVDVFTDLCIMAMPLRLIYNVRISPRQKVGLVCVFGLCFVMIAFAIIRAKQVLVPQYFVNLTLLMIWSTLAASISVIVGSLPALKLFVTNRASTRRSRYGSSGSRRKPPSDVRSNSIPLSSLSSDKKSPSGRRHCSGDSQEEILKSDDSQFVLVTHDITVSYGEVGHPDPVYQNRQHVSGYGEAV
ncbi:hypothetical protein QBC33DRAFT_593369 [Phialemonium atrogriseum]|uniref:Rhodopsin domain-containing protein n=1 Tax=Phialemonium atrogriseum TaxID=1093897 RepID=A0AAJ0FK79_9PEZI|nr:uncharacterized protein QBC33DRAFT_593369 [Phialemonium atrogriseum]KAK1765269.1 hypothetical protein QBC33DRAFT_593369 [Phialemonium atrogriseum]